MKLSVMILIGFLLLKCISWVNGDKVANGHVAASWWEVGKLFTNIANNALYRRELQDVIENDFQWATNEIDPNEVLQQQLAKVEPIFQHKVEGLKKFQRAIVELYPKFENKTPKVHCCNPKEDDIPGYGGCFHGKGLTTSFAATPPQKLMEQMRNIVRFYANVKILYMSFTDGGIFFYPDDRSGRQKNNRQTCLNYQADVRPWYKLAESPQPRDVVLLVDMYRDESSASKKLNKLVFESVIRSLSTEDRIAIATKNRPIDRWRHVQPNTWLIATPRNIDKLIQILVDVINSDNITLKEPYDFRHLNNRASTVNKLFQSPIKLTINISRPVSVKVLVQISSRKKFFNCSHFEAWNGENNVMTITYLTNTDLNKESVDCKNRGNYKIVHIQNETSLDIKENTFSYFFKWSDYMAAYNLTEVPVRMTMPYSSSLDRGILFSLTMPIIIDGTFVGVAATDFHNSHDPNDVEFILGIKDSYSFLIDNQGRALFHPFLPSPLCRQHEDEIIRCEDTTLEFIHYLEQEENILDVIQSMVDMQHGNKTVMGNIVLSTGHVTRNMSNLVTLKPTELLYMWTPLRSANLSLAIVLPLYKDKVFNASFKCSTEIKCNRSDFHYHLDIPRTKSKTCIYFGAEVLKDEGVIQFAPALFRNPIPHKCRWANFTKEDPVTNALKLGKPFDSVLKGRNIHQNINLLESLKEVWKKGQSLDCFVGIRYASTPDGVMMSYPGTVLAGNYDTRKRSWYQSGAAVIDDWNSMSLTLPYRDYFSGGKVITLVTPLLKKFDSGLTVLVAMAAADFTVELIKKRLSKVLMKNNNKETNYFLMDTMGYIPLHLNKNSESETHITEMEPMIAKNLINGNILRRTGCHDFEQDLLFLYWSFELSYGTTTYSSTENGLVFSLYKIPFTNLYLVASEQSSAAITDHAHASAARKTTVCSTTCSKSMEPPCKVPPDIQCKEEKQDLRLPACLPNYDQHIDISKRTCDSSGKNYCYDPFSKPECSDLQPVCQKT